MASFISDILSPSLSNFIISFLTASGPIDFGSILPSTSNDQTIAVIGAIVGDVIVIGKPIDQDSNLIVEAFISAADVVTLRAHNVGLITVDQVAKTYKVTVFH